MAEITRLVKVNELYQSLSTGLNGKTTYNLEGTKFNATNARFVSGFEAYKEGTTNPRSNHNKIRPNNGLLRFDIVTDANGRQSVTISFDNAPINERELFADAVKGFGKFADFVGNRVEEAGYVAGVIPGAQKVGVGLIAIGKGVSLVGDAATIGGNLLEGKKKDAAIRTGFAIVGYVAGEAINKIPLKDFGKQSIDSYVGRGTGFIKDGYFDNRAVTVEESDKLELKIEEKKWIMTQNVLLGVPFLVLGVIILLRGLQHGKSTMKGLKFRAVVTGVLSLIVGLVIIFS